MFFKTGTVYKGYATEKAAQAYVAKWFANNRDQVTIQVISGQFWVVAA